MDESSKVTLKDTEKWRNIRIDDDFFCTLEFLKFWLQIQEKYDLRFHTKLISKDSVNFKNPCICYCTYLSLLQFYKRKLVGTWYFKYEILWKHY